MINILQKTKTLEDRRRGVTIVVVIVVLAAILSIGVSVSNIVIGELRLARQIEYSFRALFAADQGLERALYRDRILGDSSSETGIIIDYIGSQACFDAIITKTSGTSITTRGFFRCDITDPSQQVQRTWQASY
jgi:hypothetical protein